MDEELEEEVLPSKTYRISHGRVIGFVDGPDSAKQAMEKVLNTELWENIIYSDDYGVELDRLIGQPMDFVISDLERTFESALSVDDRFISINSFEATNKGGGVLEVVFEILTTEGSFGIEREMMF